MVFINPDGVRELKTLRTSLYRKTRSWVARYYWTISTLLISGISSFNLFKTPSRTATAGIGHLPHEQPVLTLKVTRKILNVTGMRVFSMAIFTTPSLKSTRVISPPSAFRTGRMLSCMILSIISNDALSSIGSVTLLRNIYVSRANKTSPDAVRIRSISLMI